MLLCALKGARTAACHAHLKSDSTTALLQGGMPGAERLGMCQELMSLLEKQRQSGRIWSAICASPAVVFEAQGWLEAKKATCHPAFVERLADQRCAASHSYHTAL